MKRFRRIAAVMAISILVALAIVGTVDLAMYVFRAELDEFARTMAENR